MFLSSPVFILSMRIPGKCLETVCIGGFLIMVSIKHQAMSKRGGLGEVPDEDRQKPLKISKPSLDSDEEDYQESECFRLREADIDGQENATLEYDDGIKITPFNMREELEEDGYFDGNGNFVFKKSVDARDNWLEDIDWAEVNRNQTTKKMTDTSISDDPPTVPLAKERKTEMYQELLRFLLPKETVLRSIKRMGAQSSSANSSSASQRWLKKKQKTTTQENPGDPEGLIRVTELADQLLQAGEFDVYQLSRECIERIVNKASEAGMDDELEALGHAFDESTENYNGPAPTDDSTRDNPENGSQPEDSEVTWHLKYSDSLDSPPEGPYTTKQLRAWVEAGKYKDKPIVLVRQANKPNGQFYNIRRIDFDLYE
ncbi:hypothetical protein CRM22_005173 [Opisthorchis felineus]|uniref:GYF domain-containing protein n=2 Tax=Opisthorchis felineus TaxID=147828 RepID=A0A4S2LSG5_OPIFE|nr:hypothetical protein CRM22_005173 [Opisthorchis felineus]